MIQSRRYIQAVYARVHLYGFHNVKGNDQEHMWTRKLRIKPMIYGSWCVNDQYSIPLAQKKAQHRECNQILEAKRARARFFLQDRWGSELIA
jgi:hypothetical protein